MTKKGYTHIIVPRSLHSQLKTLAQQNGMSISQLINQLISISINVSLNIGINTSINTTSQNKPNPSLMQALNQQNSQKQTALAKREGMETVGCHQMVRPPGFEPGIAGLEGFHRCLGGCVLTRLDDGRTLVLLNNSLLKS